MGKKTKIFDFGRTEMSAKKHMINKFNSKFIVPIDFIMSISTNHKIILFLRDKKSRKDFIDGIT